MKTANYRGIVFDMDGTLTRPVLDFAAIRAELGIKAGDVAHFINALPVDEQRAAWGVVERHEAEALKRVTLQPGADSLLAECVAAGIKLGVVTRNTRHSVDIVCRNFGLQFDCVLTRTFEHMKPHPGPVLHMLQEWQLEAQTVIMVGDYVHDIDCGRGAGVVTCFYQNEGCPDHGAEADFTVCSMLELRDLIFGLIR